MLGRTLGTAAFLLTITASIGGVGAESSREFIVTDRDCAAFQSYGPDPSVEAKPGVDVHGREVAPADLDGGLTIKPDINIPITVDVRPWVELDPRRRGGRVRPRQNDPDPKDYDAQALVGVVSFADGKLYFDGQQLGAAEEHAVLAACADYLKRTGR